MRALAGRGQAIAKVVQDAEKLLADGLPEPALVLLEQAQSTYPEAERIRELLNQAREELSLQQRRQKRAAAARQRVDDARALLAKGNLDQAVQEIQHAAAEFPDEPDLPKLLVEAREQVELRNRNQAVDAVLADVAKRAEQRDFPRAIKTLEKALKTWPGESRLVQQLQIVKDARTEWAREESERERRAEAALRTAQEARQLLAQDRPADAVKLLEGVLSQQPAEQELARLLGQAQDALQIHEKRKAVEAAARQAEGRWAEKDFAAALRTVEQALGRWPDEGRLQDLLPKIKADQAEWERQQEIAKAIRECEQLANAQRLEDAVAATQAAMRRFGAQDALAQLLKGLEERLALQRRAEALRARIQEGERVLQQGKPEEAVLLFEKLGAENPTDEVVAQWLAKARAELQKKQRAEAIEATAREAERLAQANDYPAALNVLTLALRSWPGDTLLIQLLQDIAEAQSNWERQNAVAAIVRAGEQLAESGRLAEALASIQSGLSQFEREPSLVQLQQRLQKQLQQQQREQGVAQACDEARQLLDQNECRKAVDLLEAAASRYANENQLQQLLTSARERLRDQQRQEAIEKAVSQAEARAEQHDFAGALKLIEKALKSWRGEAALLEVQTRIRDARAQWEQQRAQAAAATAAAKAPEPAPAVPAVTAVAPSKKLNPLMLAGIGAAVVLAAAVVVVPRMRSTSGATPVTITTNITGASVKVGDQACVTPGCSLHLPAGSYQIAATKPGYQSVQQALSVKSGGSEMAVPLVLQPLPELVQVNTNFASGKVLLDGKPAGDLRDGQFSISDVSAGNHTVRVTSGDSDFDVEWRSTPGSAPEITRPLSAKNVQATVVANAGDAGSVACNCDVSTLQVDGKPAGSAASGGPAIALKDLKEGALRISAADRSLLVDVRPNPALTIQLASDRNVGTLVISAGQDGARVLLNGRPYRRVTEHGTLRIPEDVGEYTVQVEKQGFRASDPQKITLNKGEEKQVSFNLTPLPSSLEIAGAVPGAQVKVDGRPVGNVAANGRLTTDVNPGRHEIEITKDDYSPARFSAEFGAGAKVRSAPQQVAMAKIIQPPPPPPAAERPDPKQIEAQDWNRVRGSSNPDELEDFVRKHPGGAHLDEARELITKLRQQAQADAARQAEQTAWDAVDKSKKAALQDFLSRYGGGAHAQEARAVVNEIDKREADAIAAQRASEVKTQEQGNRSQADTQAITQALTAFESAYNSKDVRALKAVWPSMPKNTGDELGAQFRYAKSLAFRLRQSGAPIVAGDTATVPCTRALEMVARDGQKVSSGDEHVRVTLERAGSAWTIRSIASN
jgi:hypothetical protein